MAGMPAKKLEVLSMNDRKIIELFLQSKKLQGFSELSIHGYKLELRKFVDFLEKEVGKSMLEIKPAHVRLYLGQNPKLKPASISRKIAILKSLYKFLINEDYIDVNIMDKIDTPKTPKSLPKFLTLEEIDAVRKACKSKRDRAIVELMFATGMRLSELQRLNRDDIDFKNNRILVTGKGSKQRYVLFSKNTEKYLKEYLATRKDENEALFLSQRGRRMSHRAIQHLMKQLGEDAGLNKNLHPHKLRHTFGSIGVQNGMNIQAVSTLMGHSSISTTQIYARLTDEYVSKEYEKLPT